MSSSAFSYKFSNYYWAPGVVKQWRIKARFITIIKYLSQANFIRKIG